MKCKNHPERDALAVCQKFNVGYCEECCDSSDIDKDQPLCYCTSPDVHCKFRPQCIVFYKHKERERKKRLSGE